MVQVPSDISVRKLVDMSTGTISREIFVNEEIYQQELERVFARSWLFIGHESQIPNPNDFFVSRMGEESVIMTRDRQGEIHVLLNTCMHRGMKVCRYDEGNTPVFSCPYHGWSYSTDGNLVSVPGELIGVPQFATAYHGELKKEEWGLISVPQSVNYKGYIWACWDKDAPSFEEYLGGWKPYYDDAIRSPDGDDHAAMIVAGVQKWVVPSNWKYGAENFIGDVYHNISHRSVDLVGISPTGKTGRWPSQSDDQKAVLARQALRLRGLISVPGRGHGGTGGVPYPIEDDVYVPTFEGTNDTLAAYYRDRFEQRQKRLAGNLVYHGGVGTIFPNMSYHGAPARSPMTISIWHPAGPQTMEMWRYYFIDKNAPDEVKNLLRHYYLRYSGPAGMTEQDDMENWNYATAASNGTMSRRSPYNYQMGIHHEVPIDGVPGAVITTGTNEQNARFFYNRWADVMDAPTWAELMP